MKKLKILIPILGVIVATIGIWEFSDRRGWRPVFLFEHEALADDLRKDYGKLAKNLNEINLRDARGQLYEQLARKEGLQRQRLPIPRELTERIDFYRDEVKLYEAIKRGYSP
jgi:hypothetical protein